jgi:hypothetical protein
MAITFVITNLSVGRFGGVDARRTLFAGAVLAASGTVLAYAATVLIQPFTPVHLIPGLIVLGMGQGLFMTPDVNAVLTEVPERHTGVPRECSIRCRGLEMLSGLRSGKYLSSPCSTARAAAGATFATGLHVSIRRRRQRGWPACSSSSSCCLNCCRPIGLRLGSNGSHKSKGAMDRHES